LVNNKGHIADSLNKMSKKTVMHNEKQRHASLYLHTECQVRKAHSSLLQKIGIIKHSNRRTWESGLILWPLTSVETVPLTSTVFSSNSVVNSTSTACICSALFPCPDLLVNMEAVSERMTSAVSGVMVIYMKERKQKIGIENTERMLCTECTKHRWTHSKPCLG